MVVSSFYMLQYQFPVQYGVINVKWSLPHI